MTAGKTEISVTHTAEAAHRLYLTHGKCENIHGHTFRIKLTLYGTVGASGMLGDVQFGDLKKAFRGFIDSTFDHHLLLNEMDPIAKELYQSDPVTLSVETFALPGVMLFDHDPTTENIARWIAEWARTLYDVFFTGCRVDVDEGPVNAAAYELDFLAVAQ